MVHHGDAIQDRRKVVKGKKDGRQYLLGLAGLCRIYLGEKEMIIYSKGQAAYLPYVSMPVRAAILQLIYGCRSLIPLVLPSRGIFPALYIRAEPEGYPGKNPSGQ